MKTMKLFSMAAVALLMAACSNSDDFDVQKPAETAGVYHFEATIVAPNADASMRTVYTEEGTTINVKWKVGDQIALVHNGEVDVAEVKTVDNVTGKATIEATITGSPSNNDDVYLAYPADAVADATTPYPPFPFTPSLDIFNKVRNQNGTLGYIQNNLDLRMGSGKLAVSGDKVTLKESVSVSSLICIWKLTLQDESSNALSATKLTFINNNAIQARATSTGKSEYYLCVVPSYIPDASGIFSFEATVGVNTYYYLKKNVTLAAGKYYQSTVKMAMPTDLSTISSNYEVKDGEILTGTLTNNVKISIADGATVLLKNVNITNLGNGCDWAGINCPGDATLVLEGTNTVCAGRDGDGYNNYPGIYIAPDKTLTIQGAGTLTAYSDASDPSGAGIGGGYDIPCGNIVINSGNITATGGGGAAGIGGGNNKPCGTITINGGTITATGSDYAAGIGGGDLSTFDAITISGGTVTATGGEYAAGIGGGRNNKTCGNITITSGVTSVTATKGKYAPNSIGSGDNGTAITVNIETGANVTVTGHALSASAVGEIVGSDGKAYAASDKDNLPSGVTAVAMVASKSGSNGLAIQLNSSPEKMNWANANTYPSSLTSVPGGTWRLPSKDDWQNMFVGCAVSGDASASDNMNPIAGFKAKIAATGITWNSSVNYWSSTESVSGAWLVGVNLGGSNALASFIAGPTTLQMYVRACLAF